VLSGELDALLLLLPPYISRSPGFYADDPSLVALKNCLQISLDCILEHEIFLISLLAKSIITKKKMKKK